MSEKPTTPDLVELVRWFIGALNRRDFDAAERSLSPNTVMEVVALGASFEGVAAIRGFYEEWTGAYEQFEIEIDEALDYGNGIVFAVFTMQGRPVGGTGHVRYRIAQAQRWEDSVVVRITGGPGHEIDKVRAAAERLAKEPG
ncbi:MAG TPA: nuclear transport factor 2 family protein [Solirubrobacteraceae bacterium]|jgi:ketosteroid isomerase-like protein|nr:nuclear transport factor 2 family protein [Solirubrobacteraceae bacterium]